MTAKFLITLLLLLHLSTAAYSIGVNYGTLGDNLPPPSKVAKFLKSQTTINSVKIFDMDPDMIKAFANSNISLSITLPNGDIPSLTDPRAARSWVEKNIKPYYPGTLIRYICVGTEVMHWGDDPQKNNLVGAMRALNNALNTLGFKNIKVTTPHSLIIMMTSEPPSQGRFRPDMGPILNDMLEFLTESKSPLMVNPYPYFGWSPENENYALFREARVDPVSKLTYANMFDALLDAVHSAAKAAGFPDVDIVVGETGWPSDCEFPVCSKKNAADYNGNLVKHVTAGKGTPLMPGRKFETFVFALFNENQKPGPAAERNWGLFYPNLDPVYDAGVFVDGGAPIDSPTEAPESAPSTSPSDGGEPSASPSDGGEPSASPSSGGDEPDSAPSKSPSDEDKATPTTKKTPTKKGDEPTTSSTTESKDEGKEESTSLATLGATANLALQAMCVIYVTFATLGFQYVDRYYA